MNRIKTTATAWLNFCFSSVKNRLGGSAWTRCLTRKLTLLMDNFVAEFLV